MIKGKECTALALFFSFRGSTLFAEPSSAWNAPSPILCPTSFPSFPMSFKLVNTSPVMAFCFIVPWVCAKQSEVMTVLLQQLYTVWYFYFKTDISRLATGILLFFSFCSLGFSNTLDSYGTSYGYVISRKLIMLCSNYVAIMLEFFSSISCIYNHGRVIDNKFIVIGRMVCRNYNAIIFF